MSYKDKDMKLSMADRRKILTLILFIPENLSDFAKQDKELYEEENSQQADKSYKMDPIIEEKLQEAINYCEELRKNRKKVEAELLKGDETQIIARLFEVMTLQHYTLLALRWFALGNYLEPSLRKEHKRVLGKRESNKNKSITTWEGIITALKKYSENDKNRGKEYTICGIAQEIHNDISTTSNTVIRYFKNYLGKDVTRKKYQLPELINMCDSR